MTYKEALKYLDSLIDYEKIDSYDYKESVKLERMNNFIERLGNPHLDLNCIHIAGTKGKGSTSAMVASVLKEAGYKVGLYTSPHLISFRERIRINDELISEEDLSRILEDKISPVIENIDKESDDYPTFFEVYTALAFSYFKEKKVDFCVLEVGMGGRLDATNVIKKPFCCGITQISYEHTQKLGNTLEEIAAQKAGIIKDDNICISSIQEDSVLNIIRKVCGERNTRLYEVGSDLYFKEERLERDPGSKPVFSVTGILNEYPSLELGLLGRHQFINATTAIGLIESLRFYDIIIRDEAVKQGLKNVQWPGRLQIIQRDPCMVLDGAQNRASARALREAVRDFFTYKKLILVLGISKDKDIKGICGELEPVSDEIILTKADLPRAEEPGVLKGFIEKKTTLTSSVQEAINIAKDMARPSDLILVTGSLFVVGEVLKKYDNILNHSEITCQR